MSKENSIVLRSSKEMAKAIRDIQEKRIKIGKDRFPKFAKAPRITLAMTRHDLFKKIKEDIINADLR